MRSQKRIPFRTGPWVPMMLVLVLSGALCDPAQALRQVTSEPDYALEPDWSPDGSQIAFARWDSVGGVANICLIDAAGGTPVLLQERAKLARMDWSPNGEFIATSGFPIGGGYDRIRLISVFDGQSRGLTGGRGDYRNPTWSPDGKWVAFDREYNHDSEVGLVPVAGGDPEWIIADASSPAWSPDSTMIAFTRWNIWVASSSGENERQLTDFPGGAGSPCWSPDSRYIAFDSNHSGNEDVWIVPVAGGDPIQVTTDPGWDGDPTWSPRGDEIAFSSTRAGRTGTDIWVIEVNLTPTKSISWGKLKTLSR